MELNSNHLLHHGKRKREWMSLCHTVASLEWPVPFLGGEPGKTGELGVGGTTTLSLPSSWLKARQAHFNFLMPTSIM